LLGDGQPKYLNSAESPLFSKRACLYGLDLARAAIRRERCAVVVEGYLDAVACHQAGLGNVVAAMGTAVGPEQLGQIKRLAPRVVLALDPDAAGDAAALRALEALRATRGRVAVPVPDRRGLVRLRYDQELDLRVARLPAGQDPDDVVRDAPARFRELVAAARPVCEGVQAAVAGGATGTTAVLETLEEPLREEARRLLAWGADLAEVPVEAREATAAVRHLRLLNRHRELALVGGRRADLEGAGERGGWAEDAGRVAALLAEIRTLEREGGPLTASWATVLRAEASPGPRRS
jgi:DNA primase